MQIVVKATSQENSRIDYRNATMEKVQILLWSVSKNVIIFSVFINKFSSAKLCHCLFFHKSFETLFDFIWLYMFMYVWWQVYPQNLLNLIFIQTFKTCCIQHV